MEHIHHEAAEGRRKNTRGCVTDETRDAVAVSESAAADIAAGCRAEFWLDPFTTSDEAFDSW